MFSVKRTPEVPRWARLLPKALCIFQRTRSCAAAPLTDATVNASTAPVSVASLHSCRVMFRSPLVVVALHGPVVGFP